MVEALYVPNFGNFLPSVPQLTEAGFDVTFRSRIATSFISSNTVAEQPLGKRHLGCRTCVLLGKPITISHVRAHSAIAAASTSHRKDLHTWHRRLAHLNFGDPRQLLPKDLYIDTSDSSETPTCQICVQAKAKVKFQRNAPVRRAGRPLELIHSDLCGPIKPQSLSGCKYNILYNDDFSRITWI